MVFIIWVNNCDHCVKDDSAKELLGWNLLKTICGTKERMSVLGCV